eukprot:1246666-Alexandrium_andersonii.AAC.1
MRGIPGAECAPRIPENIPKKIQKNVGKSSGIRGARGFPGAECRGAPRMQFRRLRLRLARGRARAGLQGIR